MKIVHNIDNLPVGHRQPRGREGAVKTSLIMGGDYTRLDNFSCRIIISEAGRFSPRHRHNFAQFYYCLDGETTFGDAKLTEGWLGYMPEGTWYGPQTGPAHTLIAFQHGGPSASGIMGYQQHTDSFEELKAKGRFEKGLYYPNDAPADYVPQDGYEAIWENLRGRKLEYPEPQYSGPINMNTKAFPWQPIEEMPGVDRKLFGIYTSCEYGAGAYRIAPGAAYTAKGRCMYIVLAGSGKIGDESYARLSAIFLDSGEDARFIAESETELLAISMPSHDDILAHLGKEKVPEFVPK